MQLLLEHLEAISPDSNDLLHELLQDLGEVPDREELLGTAIKIYLFFVIKTKKRRNSYNSFYTPLFQVKEQWTPVIPTERALCASWPRQRSPSL